MAVGGEEGHARDQIGEHSVAPWLPRANRRTHAAWLLAIQPMIAW